MHDKDWVLIDTETTGFTPPIIVVELAAQKMRGWEPLGPPFQRLLNQNADIPSEASRVHGYTREILERDGHPAHDVYRQFAEYSDGIPIVAYNLRYDLEDVLKPEWKRLGIQPIGSAGFCALRLAQRLLDPVPAGNCKLQTLRQYYRLPERGAHTALGDVETVVDLLRDVLRPIAASNGLVTWSDICAFSETEWFPSRIAFGRFKGRDYRDASGDEGLRGWLEWLADSANGRSAQMGKWYLRKLQEIEHANERAIPDRRLRDEGFAYVAAGKSECGIIQYVNPEIEQLQGLISAARSRLAEVEAQYTKDRRAVDLMQATIFKLVRAHYQSRDNIRLIVEYRRKYLNTLLQEGEDEAEEVAQDYQNAKAQSDSNYDQAAQSAANQKALTEEELGEIQSLWKRLVRLFHPDRFAQQPEKRETYERLTGAINKARDEGDIDLLRDIGADPSAFVLRQGWSGLDFGDEMEVRSLRKLYATLQVEIVKMLDALNELHESPDFQLYVLSEKQPGLLEQVADDQIKALVIEIAQLEAEATRLKEEIDALNGAGLSPVI